jgi:hypothetical protein
VGRITRVHCEHGHWPRTLHYPEWPVGRLALHAGVCTHHFSTAYIWNPTSSIRSTTISNRCLWPIQRSPSVTSPCSLLHIPGNDASPYLSTVVFVEPERDRTPDNRPEVGLARGERVGGTEGDAGDAYGVGDRTVGINRRNGGLGLAIASRRSQSCKG